MALLSPDDYYRSVGDMPLAQLAAEGFDALLVDLDNTLLPRNSSVVPDSAKRWAASARDNGFNVVLVSNNWHDRVKGVAEELGFGLVPKALKPLPFAFLSALREVGSSPARAVVVGDQMFTDILGGKILGARTVLVAPLSSSDLPHTLLLRKIERVLLAGRQPLP